MARTLEQLRAECMQCRRCGLCETRHNVVFGDGPDDAEVMFIGEGPGENEDLQGEAFVGRGGQLLDRYLHHIDLDRSRNIYIANMVKCRPPKNRDPQQDEMDCCIDWLRNQVYLIRPKIIVCLGRIAAQRLIDPKFRVTKEHGRFVEKSGIWMMGTYHPAALLRNPASKPDALEDMVALREKILEVCPETYSL